jgi:hypothetical protein
MSDADEDVEVRYAPTSTTSILGQCLAPFAVPLAVIAFAMSIWAVVCASTNTVDSAVLPGDSKVRVCNAFDMVVKAVALQTHNDLAAGNTNLALVGGGDYLLRQLDVNTPAHLADAIRAFARDLQGIGMNALAGVHNSDPRQAARQVEGDFDRKQVGDLCK